MSSSIIIKKINKNIVVRRKTASNKWICKVSISHRVIIKAKYPIKVNFFFSNDAWVSLFLPKSPHPKVPIIEINYSKHRACWILLDFFDLDILVFSASNHLFKSFFISLKVMHLNIHFIVIFLHYRDSSLWIISNHHTRNRILRINTKLPKQILKRGFLPQKTNVWLIPWCLIPVAVFYNNFTRMNIALSALWFFVLGIHVIELFLPTRDVSDLFFHVDFIWSGELIHIFC